MIARHGKRLSGSASTVILVIAATALLIAPVSRSNCSPVYESLRASDTRAPDDSEPVQDPAEVSSDRTAVVEAQAALSELAKERSDAATLEAEAVTAETAAEEADGSDYLGVDYEVESAESTVESDLSTVEFAESWLQDAKDWRAEGFGTQQEVNDAQTDLDAALAELAEDRKKLADLKSQAVTAAKLTRRAARARAAADAASQRIDSRVTLAESELSDAQAQTEKNLEEHAATVALWTRAQIAEGRAVNAKNAVLSDCRREAKGMATIAGGLVAIGLLFPTLSLLGRVRFPRRMPLSGALRRMRRR